MALGKHSRVFGGVLLQLVCVKVRAAGAAIASRPSILQLDYQTTPARPFFGRSYAAFFCKILYHHPYCRLPSARQKRHITSLTRQYYRFEACWPRRSLGILLAPQHDRSTAAPYQACDRHLRKRHTYPSLSSLPCS
jgi:hypothetical protein